MRQIAKIDGYYQPAGGSLQSREPASAPPPEALDLRAVLKRLWKRKRLVAAVAVLTAVPAVIASLLATPFYSSSAMIQVNPDPVQVLPYRDIADSGGGVYYEVLMSTQDQILKSGNLLARVAARLQSDEDVAALRGEIPSLAQRFQVYRVPNSQLFRISYRSPSADAAAHIVNIFAEEYIKQHLEGRQETRERARESLERELDGLEGRLQLSETGLVSYARSQDITNLESAEGSLVQRRLSALDEHLAAAENEVVLARHRLEIKKKASMESFTEAQTTPVITGLTSRLLQAEQELTNLRAKFGENWPAVVSKRDELRLIQEQLARQKALVVSRDAEQAQRELDSALSRRGEALRALAEQKEAVNRYNNALIQYNILRREVETNRRLYDGLLERLRQTSLQKGFEFGNLQVVDPGRPSNATEAPRLWYNIALASLVGLTLGVGTALLRDFWDNSMSTLEGVEEATRLPGLGSMPSSRFLAHRATGGLIAPPPAGDRGVVALGLSRWPVASTAAVPPPEVAEAIRAVCASILLSQSDKPLRLIAVTSAAPGEGKTTFVAEVGRALAESGAKTLLVEADLRKPMLASFFDIGEGDGLSLYLSGHAAAPRICETGQPNLFVAPAGPRPPNPVALLGSERMNTFLQQAAGAFRFVLLDTPPVLAVADGRVVGAKADGLILVVRANKTAKSLVLRARGLLQSSGVNLLGTVLTRVDPADLYTSYTTYYATSAT